jgi:hypothetical protein
MEKMATVRNMDIIDQANDERQKLQLPWVEKYRPAR